MILEKNCKIKNFRGHFCEQSDELARINRAIGLMSRVFGNGLGDWGSLSGQFIPKNQKMVLDAALLNTQYYKVWIKGKVEKSKERSSTLPYTSV